MNGNPPFAGDSPVWVVTVTYGNRWDYLKIVLERVLSMAPVTRVVVVDNGSSYDIAQRLRTFDAKRVLLVSMPGNCGSAAGYKAGIQAAVAQSGCGLIWLLDDDNVPGHTALDELLERYAALGGESSLSAVVVLALRDDRPQFRLAAAGVPVVKCFPRRNSYLGFHGWHTLVGKIGKLSGLNISGQHQVDSVRIPYGIYGGLLFHRSVINRIGYPDEAFYLYGDDNEFTLRFTRSGGILHLVPSATITDLESSWHVKSRSHASSSSFLRNCLDAPEFRLYYSMRNGAYLWKKYFDSTSFVYRLNRMLYLATLWLYLALHGAHERFALIRSAIAEGETGQLGKRDLVASTMASEASKRKAKAHEVVR